MQALPTFRRTRPSLHSFARLTTLSLATSNNYLGWNILRTSIGHSRCDCHCYKSTHSGTHSRRDRGGRHGKELGESKVLARLSITKGVAFLDLLSPPQEEFRISSPARGETMDISHLLRCHLPSTGAVRSINSSLTLVVVRVNTIIISAVRSDRTEFAHADFKCIPEEETRALILVLSAFSARVSDIEEFALAIASVEALVTIRAFVADQKVDFGRAVVVVTSERGALRRREEPEVILALLSENGPERVGTGLEVTASIVAVHSS